MTMTTKQVNTDLEEKPKKTGWRGPAGSINKAGRPPAPKGEKPTNRELRERELMMLLRKIRPHVATAVSQAAKIMQDNEASHMNQLKAATILLDAYRKLTLDVYDGEEPDAEGTEIQEQNNAPNAVFSLKIIGNDDDN